MPQLTNKLIASLIAIVFVLAFVFGVFWYIQNKDKAIIDLTKDNASKNVVIETQKDSIEKDIKSDKVNEQTNLAVAKKSTEVRQKQKQVIDASDKKIADLEKEFEKKPQTLENAVELANRKSAVRIDNLWELYCKHLPNSQGCFNPGGV